MTILTKLGTDNTVDIFWFLHMAWTKSVRETDGHSRKCGWNVGDMSASPQGEACELAGVIRALQAMPLSTRIRTRAYEENIRLRTKAS